MQNRHRCENNLFTAIENYNTYVALERIDTILNYPSPISLNRRAALPKLSAINNDGKSFLYFAMEMCLPKVALKLFSLLKNDEQFIFRTTPKQQTHIHAAVQSASPELLSQLIEFYAKHNQDWMAADKDGNTPLHYAVNNDCLDCLEVLVAKIIADKFPNKLDLLNRQGDTALSKALNKTPRFDKAISILAQAINSWTFFDNQALDLFAKMPADSQIIIITDMIEDVRRNFLSLYLPFYQKLVREDQIKEPHFTTLFNIYVKLFETRSLRSLLAAHHQFNKNISPINLSHKLNLNMNAHYQFGKTTLPLDVGCDSLQLSKNLITQANLHLEPRIKDDFSKVHTWINQFLNEVTKHKEDIETTPITYSKLHRTAALTPPSLGSAISLAFLIYV